MLKWIDVDRELTSCLRNMGAVVADDSKGPNKPRNADFWFPADGVIAEMKCMSVNYFADGTFQDWLTAAYRRWVTRELAPAGLRTVNLADLPMACYQDVTSFLRKRVEGSFKAASKQIQATKISVGRPDATGLLFLINDGNYGLVPAMLQSIVARSIDKYSGINCVIHFTANMPSEVPGIDEDLLYWCSWSKSSARPAVDSSFLARVREAWLAHHATAVGQSIPKIDGTARHLLGISYIKR
ncbi:hypothetical protein HIV01_003460 [Lysobacter arenosi]|uniref:Uncharacterized protein n=1 Tax=Lysobacter arenosi TaxID=2795387 RepID=A0ABX7RDY3_9GAMM|nr:hypothetical protein [Lysobacter arenosi]QSX75602.1 hypothetical protein HIV01_003460 [Lysobacter arenosi]